MTTSKSALLICLFTFLAGCVGSEWETSYRDIVTREQAESWRVSEIDVQVPEYLTVTEANSYAPDADILWMGEPKGDRRQQVDDIITEAASRGSSGLYGRQQVRLDIIVLQFHALTERARTRLTNSGVHNIMFSMQVFDLLSGEPLTELDIVHADLEAWSGARSALEIERGNDQKTRITKQ